VDLQFQTVLLEKNNFQKHGSTNNSSGYIGNLYLFNVVLMAIVLVVVFGRLL